MNDERKPVGQQKPMEAAATRKKVNAKPAKLGRDVQARLGQQLRAMYDEVVADRRDAEDTRNMQAGILVNLRREQP